MTRDTLGLNVHLVSFISLILIRVFIGPIAAFVIAFAALGLAATWFFLQGLLGIGGNGSALDRDQTP